ncbi:uncharacterized protein K452DRAFT_260221 [Aplosporella prunicola CBS 121167]|uniref:Uncharacterized protein n=1 Tax=Aplosporella prunicola CBS 121167 TaxID=1176127 RepID=A0A6A6AXQ7_9PEZI|nr:uncharacterized protein K452DRAFT_260221 [Aplosporella prunicola CBS 121167]KAF2135734.1 hypothetical protein K452DRAFT_260221 [Aplosporella prunicola CBS 121167]
MHDSSPFDSPTFGRDASIRVDEPVGSASISPSSRDVVLASREGLHIIDLDNPYSPPRHLAHRTLWEVADVQWSPFACRDGLVASTSNQKALIWDLHHATQPPLTLHAHSRAITDVNLSAHHPDILATCSVDTFVHKWDLRASDRPVFSYAQWDGGAAQVKWNRQDPHILASAHDKLLCIWDERKGVKPLRTIEAHKSKIYGVDWNRTRAGGILTCSLDGSIKFWDYTKDEDDMLDRVIRTPFGVWRARHTPFGWGALAMPQRGDFDLHLYDRRLSDGVKRDAKVDPVHSFKAHNDQVKEFLWRTRGNISDGIDNREFQLVSWGADRMLNLYRVDSTMLRSVGYEKGKEVRKRLMSTRQGTQYKTFHDDNPAHTSAQASTIGDQYNTFAPPSQLSALFQSAGMRKPAPQYAQGGFQGPSGSSKRGRLLTTMQARTREKKNVDKLTWMQGVRIGGTKGPFDRTGSRPDVFSPDQQLLWDSPDQLGEEIKYVGNKFKKVKFEEIEIPQRTATVTLHGPWAENNEPVFMRISIRFPPDYPIASTPHCKIEKTTSSISTATVSKLDSEIKSLAEFYKTRKRGSLDAIISYLLGERGLDESISLLSDGGADSVAREEESSSDEEDEVGPSFGGTPAMEMSGTDIMGPVTANANVPLPKRCGALWTRDGRLITFFPPKPEPKPMFSHLAALSNDNRTYKSKRIFEVLSRLNTESPEPVRKNSSTMGHQDDADSQGSWETSSSSSSDSPVMGGLSAIAPPVAWRGGPLRFQRSSQHSGSVSYDSKPAAPKPKSIISVYDFSYLLPAKRELAEEYEVFGEGPEVSAHNARVASDHGYKDLADVWNLVGLILADQVPLEIMQQGYRREPILTVARRSVVRIKKKDSGLDLGFDEPEAVARPKLKGRVKWGEHPFAKQLIPRLFEHFEKLADTQMLAMLACMFHEPAANEGVTNAMTMRLPHPDLHLSMRTPAFSLDYYPSREVAASLFQPSIAIPSRSESIYSRYPGGSDSNLPKIDKRLNTFGSAGSSNGPWSGDVMPSGPTTPYSTGTTPPPTFSRTNTYRSFSSAQPSLASSPERSKRSTTNLSTAWTSFSRPFTTGVSSSPPVPNPQRNYDGDLSTSAPTNSVTWGPNVVYHNEPTTLQRSSSHKRSKTQVNTSFNSSVSAGAADNDDDDERWPDDESAFPSVDDDRTVSFTSSSDRTAGASIRVTLKNQDQFDDDGHLSVPLLEQDKGWLYDAYRASYAGNELYMWGLQVRRSEVLKFNGLTSYWVKNQMSENAEDELSVGRSKEAANGQKVLMPDDDVLSLVPLTTKPVSTPSTGAHIHSNHSTKPPSLYRSTTPSTTRPSSTRSATPALERPEWDWSAPLANAALDRVVGAAGGARFSIDVGSARLGGGRLGALGAFGALGGGFGNGGAKEVDDVDGEEEGLCESAFLAQRRRVCMVCWLQLDGLYRTCADCGHAVHAECGVGCYCGEEEWGAWW